MLLGDRSSYESAEVIVIVLGLVLLLLGLLLKISILTTIGIIVLVIGLVLLLLGSMGRSVGGRRHYF
jgi:membrane-bound ClpP family serine protease